MIKKYPAYEKPHSTLHTVNKGLSSELKADRDQ